MTNPGEIIDNEIEQSPKPIVDMTDEELDALQAKMTGKQTEDPKPEEPPAAPPKAGQPREPDPAPTLEKVVSDQRVFIGRQTTEIGELRKQVAQLQQMMLEQQRPKEAPPTEPKPDENEEFFKDPINKVRTILEEREKKKAADQAAEQQTKQANRQRVVEAIPDFDSIVQDVFAILLTDGFTEDQVVEFAKNPWAERPEALIALGKRAQAERRLRELEAGTKPAPAPAPAAESKAKPKAPRNPITSATGQTRQTANYLNGLSDTDIAKMSDEQLNEILTKAKSAGG